MSDEIRNNGIENEDVEYIADAEFEEMIRNGLNASFDADDITVSEELIAKTLKAIEGTGKQTESATENSLRQAEPKKTRILNFRRIGVISGIAAALFLGVIGISMMSGGMTKKEMSNDVGASEMYSMKSEATADSSYSKMQKSDSVQMNSVADATYDICEECEDDCMDSVAPTTVYEMTGGESIYRIGSDAMDRMLENILDMLGEYEESVSKKAASEVLPEAASGEGCCISVIYDGSLASDECETMSPEEILSPEKEVAGSVIIRSVVAYEDRIVVASFDAPDNGDEDYIVETFYSEDAVEIVYGALENVWGNGNGGED